MSEKLSISEQARIAARNLDSLFNSQLPPVPEGATIDSLWAEVCRLRKHTPKPRKVEAIRMILEDPRLVGLSIPLIADIIKKVFHHNGVSCDTSDSSIRWYISQKTLEWNIQPRDKNPIDVSKVLLDNDVTSA